MKESVKKLIQRKGPLAENEVKDVLSAYGIRTTKYKVVSEIKDLEKLGSIKPDEYKREIQREKKVKEKAHLDEI